MTLTLRTRMVLGFVTVGLGVLLTASVVYYVPFQSLVRSSLEAELIHDTLEFAETLEWENGRLEVLDDFVWNDIDEERVEAVDLAFRTLRKENLEGTSLVSMFAAKPVNEPTVLHAEIDGEKQICAIRPITRENRVVAYILLAESAEQAGAYVEILQESILVTFVFLLIFGAATGYLIARRLLRPMVAIQAAIGEIDLRKLNRRIERVSDDPEVTSLVDTLNGLFERKRAGRLRPEPFGNPRGNAPRDPHRGQPPDARSKRVYRATAGGCAHSSAGIYRTAARRLGGPLFPQGPTAFSRRSSRPVCPRRSRPVDPVASEPRIQRIQVLF